MENVFKYAVKHKLTFNTSKGVLKVEDLYDLKLTELDAIYANLKKKQDSTNQYTLLDKKSAGTKTLEAQIELIKQVVEDKKADIEKAEKKAKSHAKHQKILELIDKKNNEALESKSIEELKAMMDEDKEEEDDE